MLTTKIFPLIFHLRSLGLQSNQFAGSLWHGAFGKVLAEQHPEAFAALYKVDDEARTYVICPPLSNNLAIDERFDVRICLFGRAVMHAAACIDTILSIANDGIPKYGKFVVEGVDWVQASGSSLLLESTTHVSHLETSTLNDYLLAKNFKSHGLLKMQLKTPLCIKEANQVVRSTPSMLQLVKRVLSRIKQVEFACGTKTSDIHDWQEVLTAAEKVNILYANNAWVELERTSSRSGKTMHFGGLVGDMLYQGDLEKIMPWLFVGMFLQIGAKTAFGFGGIQVDSFLMP